MQAKDLNQGQQMIITNLEYANLSGANLTGSNLEKSSLIGTNLNKVILCKTIMPWGKDNSGC